VHPFTSDVIIEVRDTSVADAPSQLLASRRMSDVHVEPANKIPFSIDAPEESSSRTISLRVHIPVSGTDRVTAGDLLTTQAHVIPPSGSIDGLRVVLQRI
jgi:uncharacterized lipoprotein YbaY